MMNYPAVAEERNCKRSSRKTESCHETFEMITGRMVKSVNVKSQNSSDRRLLPGVVRMCLRPHH